MTMIMKASPAVKAILKVLTTKTTTVLKLRVRKYALAISTVKSQSEVLNTVILTGVFFTFR